MLRAHALIKTAALLSLLFIAGCAPVLLDWPKFDPRLKWQTIEAAHFQVHFHQGEEEIAHQAAASAEEAHAKLLPILRWEPKDKTQIVLLDSFDIANGMATPFPNNSIYINLTPPPNNHMPFQFRHDDWLRWVITHEYVHILHLDTVEGFPAAMRMIFGRNIFTTFLIFNSPIPNVWQPIWLIEGLATYEETQLGTSDRRDSAYFDMILRMAILEKRFPKLDQASGMDTWPRGTIPYLYGSRFYEYLVKKYGDRILSQISHDYSSHPFPFFVDTTAKMVVGQDYIRLWLEWQTELTKTYQKQAEEIRARGLTTPSQALTDRGYQILGPAAAPDGSTIAYTDINADRYPAIRLIHEDGTGEQFLTRRNWGYSLSWSPNGKQIAYSQLEFFRDYSVYEDLYLYDLRRCRTTRLTKGLRASDPDFSPDGKRLVFIKNHLGETGLAIYDLDTRQITEISISVSHTQMAHPRWSPDGRRIAVEVWDHGIQDIYLVQADGGVSTPIFRDKALDLFPVWSLDGRYLLFSSDRTGIYNLFAYDIAAKKLFQVTNLLGGAFTPSISPDQKTIFFSSYSSKGFDLHRMAWDPSTWREAAVPPPSDRLTDPPAVVQTEPIANPSVAQSPTYSYSAWPTIRPRFWAPIYGFDEEGLQLGFVTGGTDVLLQHKYFFAGLIGLRTARPAFNLQYINDQFYPSFHFRVSDLPFFHADLLRDATGAKRNYWERQQRAGLDVHLPILTLQSQHHLILGYQAERLNGLTEIPPGFTIPQEGDLVGFRTAWVYNNSQEYDFSISPEEGRRLSVAYAHLDPAFGSDFVITRILGDWREYISLPFSHQVAALRIAGGYASGNVILQRAFQLGGPMETEEIIDLDEEQIFLRGFSSREFRGQRFGLGSLEYRFPFPTLERGYESLPFFFRRFHGTIFADAGSAWDREPRLKDFHIGAGAEIKCDLTFAYRIPLRLRLGIARGFGPEAITQVYLALGNSF